MTLRAYGARYHWLCWWFWRQFVRPQYSVLYGRTHRTLAALWEWSQAQLVRHLIAYNRKTR